MDFCRTGDGCGGDSYNTEVGFLGGDTMKKPCFICGRDMHDDESGNQFIGLSIDLRVEHLSGFERVYPELKDFHVDVCYVCWLKSVGVTTER